MYIEDLLPILSHSIKLDPYDQKMIDSFYSQINISYSAFTEKQAAIMLRISRKYVPEILTKHGTDITGLLDAPVYRLPIRNINLVRKISVTTLATGLKGIKVQFPWDEALITEIKKAKMKFIYNEWNADDRAWIFSLEGKSIEHFGSWITNYNFSADDEFRSYVEQVLPITNEIEHHVPMVVLDGKIAKFVNVHHTVPQPTSTDLIQTLFSARQSGISHWDDNTVAELDKLNIDLSLRKYIESDPNEAFSINLEENSIMELIPMIQNLSPCIITVPGGNEFNKVKIAMSLLKAAGIENHEISVLFRLPKETGEDFNNFVKEEKLNSPVTETTKAVLLSGKIPKPLFESKLQFNCVINFNFYNVHYTLANFVKNQHNVINVLADKTTKKVSLGYM